MRIILVLQTLQQWILRTIVKILPCARKDDQLLFCVKKEKRKLTVLEQVVNIIGVSTSS